MYLGLRQLQIMNMVAWGLVTVFWIFNSRSLLSTRYGSIFVCTCFAMCTSFLRVCDVCGHSGRGTVGIFVSLMSAVNECTNQQSAVTCDGGHRHHRTWSGGYHDKNSSYTLVSFRQWKRRKEITYIWSIIKNDHGVACFVWLSGWRTIKNSANKTEIMGWPPIRARQNFPYDSCT